MRVIAGSAKSLPLKTIEGLDTRPTTDRIKETLFNMINFRIADSTFLDLYSGSGGIGIEALSRGADFCYFVDNNPKAVQCIEENLEFTKLKDKAAVLRKDVFSAIKYLAEKGRVFSVIFMDPPYSMHLEKETLECLAQSKLINEDSLLIVEARIETEFGFLPSIGLKSIREKEYKTNKHVFIGLE